MNSRQGPVKKNFTDQCQDHQGKQKSLTGIPPDLKLPDLPVNNNPERLKNKGNKIGDGKPFAVKTVGSLRKPGINDDQQHCERRYDQQSIVNVFFI
jgi:hypothetical protein